MIKKFFPIILLTFVNVIGFSILIPVLPQIIRLYVPEHLIGVSYGILLSSYSLFQFIGAPILGSLSDKYGRRPILFLSQLGTTLSWVIFAFAYFTPNLNFLGIGLPLYVITLSRITDGITGGNISVANAWISDMTTKEDKTKAFGLIGAMFGIGFLVGPALGGLTTSFGIGYLGTIFTAFIISLFTLLQIYFYLPESLPKEKRSNGKDKFNFLYELNILNKFKQFKNNKIITDLLFLRLFIAITFAAFTTIIILYMEHVFGLSPQKLGLTLSVVGLFSILNYALVTPKISKLIGNMNALYLALFLISFSLVIIPFTPNNLFWGSINIGYIIFIFETYITNLGIGLSLVTFKSLKNTPTEQAPWL